MTLSATHSLKAGHIVDPEDKKDEESKPPSPVSSPHIVSPYRTGLVPRPIREFQPPALTQHLSAPVSAPEEKRTLGDRLKIALGLSTLAFAESGAYMPLPQPLPPPVASISTPVPTQAPFYGLSAVMPSATETFHPGPVDSIVNAMAQAQPEKPAPDKIEEAKAVLRTVYEEALRDLHDPKKIAEKLTDEVISETVKQAIHHSIGLAAAVWIALKLKHAGKEKKNPVLSSAAEKLEVANERQARGGPVTINYITVNCHCSPEEARAALEAGLYTAHSVWMPAE